MKLKIKNFSGALRGNDFFKAVNAGNTSFLLKVGKNTTGKYVVFWDGEDNKNIVGRVCDVDGDAKDYSALDVYMGGEYLLKIDKLEDDKTMQLDLESSFIATAKKKTNSAIDKMFQDLVDDKTLSEDDATAIWNILEDNKVNNVTKEMLCDWYRNNPYRMASWNGRQPKKPSSIYRYCDPKELNGFYSTFSIALMNALMRKPMLYIGSKSVGKNVCAETLAFVLQMPYYITGFNSNMISDDIYGGKTVSNDAAKRLTKESAEAYIMFNANADKYSDRLGDASEFALAKAQAASMNIELEHSEFVTWLETGGVIMLNEINMASANFLQSFINQIADGTGFINIPGKGIVKVNENCVMIGSANMGYAGTNDLNAATKSRFGGIRFPYPESIEVQLKSVIEEKYGSGVLPNKYYSQCNAFYSKVRLAASDNGFSVDSSLSYITDAAMNIRGFVSALSLVVEQKMSVSLKQALLTHVVSLCEDEEFSALSSMLAEHIRD